MLRKCKTADMIWYSILVHMAERQELPYSATKEWSVVMNIIIDIGNKKAAKEIKKLILIYKKQYKIKVIISKSTDKAVKTCSKILADCIIYDRHTTSQFNEYFSQYTYNGLWFVPVSFIDDKMDVVDAINTGRTAYYITMPIDKDIVSTMLKCISKKIKRL